MKLKAKTPHKRNWNRRLIVSVVVSVVLVFADYWIQNITYPLFDDVNLLTWVDKIMGTRKAYFEEDNVTYINLGKDKMLVPAVDEWGDTIGNNVISDRESLLQLLTIASQSNYKYIFLDVRFERGYDTPFDSALFACIKAMPNLVVATHRENGSYAIADSTLLTKAANADYRNALHAGFSRYEFLQDGRRSVALQMLHDIDHHDIEKRWYGYVCDDGHLCYNMKYIPLPSHLFEAEQKEMGGNTMGEEIRYPYLGSYILNQRYFSEEELVKNLLDDKLVVVGDFDNDLHDTYIGEIPGPVLPLAAYKFMAAGLHRVNVVYLTVLFLIFGGICFVMLSVRHVANMFAKNTWANYLLSLLGLGFLFFLIKVFSYYFFAISMIMVLPTLVFHTLGNRSTYKTILAKLTH